MANSITSADLNQYPVLLDYLKNTDIMRYRALIKVLDLRK